MSKGLRLGEGLVLPEGAASQVIADMGRRGSGKTYAAGKIVEGLLDRRDQVVVLDPVGTWWGLRLLADGKTPGYDIAVLGGERGDIPLQPSAGKLVASLVAQGGHSLVLDVSAFTLGEQRRFVADFATELLALKRRHKSPLMVVLEEAQEFVPQMVRAQDAVMVGAVTRLVKVGRNHGVGALLVSQRPQAVSKEVLNQAELLLAFQMTGPQERKTVDGWVQEKGADRSLVGELPGLPVGTAMVWSPQWLGMFGKFAIGRKRTYDASATPTGRESTKPVTPAPLDLEKVRTAMAATIERAKAEDPRELRKQLAEWKARAERATKDAERATALAEQGAALYKAKAESKVVEKVVEKRVEVPVFRREEEARLVRVEKGIERLAVDLAELVTRVRERTNGKVAQAPAVFAPSRAAVVAVAEGRSAAGANPAPSQPMEGVRLGKGERTVLNVLAQWPQGRNYNELAFLAGYSARASTVGVILANLRRAGLVNSGDRNIQLTEAGLVEAGGARPLPAGQELLDHWRRHPRMGEGERKVLDVLLESYPEALSKEELCERTGYSPVASTMGVILSKLRKLGLVEKGARRLASEFVEAVTA